MGLTNVDLYRVDGTLGSVSNISTSALNGGPLSGTRNRIINGDMRIDQRNAGAGVSTSNSFPVDRFSVSNTGSSTFTAARGTGGPAGYTNFLSYNVTTGAAVSPGDQVFFRQIIEGVNGADLGWGSPGAQSITIGFWVRSSLTGTFGLAVQNYSANRSYVASYSINSANTWEYKTVTITGDTSGTWNTDTANGWASIIWDLGTGTTASNSAGSWAAGSYRGLTGGIKVAATSSATFYITGVQLEAGTVATPFERRSYGQELALCQRYYCKTFDQSVAPASSAGQAGALFASGNTTPTINKGYAVTWHFPVTMRAAPSVTSYNPSTTGSGWYTSAGASLAQNIANIGTQGTLVTNGATAAATGENACIHLTASIEL